MPTIGKFYRKYVAKIRSIAAPTSEAPPNVAQFPATSVRMVKKFYNPANPQNKIRQSFAYAFSAT
jgi:hypothetical protein